MALAWAILITVGAAVVAVGAMLLLRSRAPEGGHFTNSDRAAGVFGVLATGFAVLLGFIVFLAFESYDASRSGAEAEALIVAQQYEIAQLMPPGVRGALGDELVCYARSVVGQEWPRMEAGTEGDTLNPWGVRLFRTLRTVDPVTPASQAAYSKWLDETTERAAARNDRLHGAEGVIPTPLWLVLFFSAAIIFAFTLCFADPGEGPVVQALLAGSVVAVTVATLLLIGFLDSPYRAGVGGIRPVAMERALRVLDQERLVVGRTEPLPCDARGVPA